MLDEPGGARIRMTRDSGGNQTRQTGLDDTKSKMAMTAGNAKVHGDLPQRKGRASAAVFRALDVPGAQGSCRGAGGEQAEPEHPAECRSWIKILLDLRGVSSCGCQGIASAEIFDEGCFAGSTTNAASSGRRKIARQTGPAARSTPSTGAPGCDACQIRSRG